MLPRDWLTIEEVLFSLDLSLFEKISFSVRFQVFYPFTDFRIGARLLLASLSKAKNLKIFLVFFNILFFDDFCEKDC